METVLTSHGAFRRTSMSAWQQAVSAVKSAKRCNASSPVRPPLTTPGAGPSTATIACMRLEELAHALGAIVVPGSDAGTAPGALEITGVAGLESAGPAQVSFLDNPKYTAAARATRAGAVIVDPSFGPLAVPTLQIANPYLAFARAIELFYQAPRYPPGIHPTAVVDASARFGPEVHIGPYAVIGAGVELGPGSVVLAHAVLYPGVKAGARFFAHAHAVVREHCVLGDDVVLGNGVVVGGDGFGFAKDDTGAWRKIPQSGHVIVGDRVEIQSNSCIDRASIGETIIANGAKIDNLVQVGHGSSVGEHTLLCAQAGLAGSSRIGRRVILTGQVGVAGHLTIGDDVIATAQSGIPNDVAAGEVVSGYPAIPNGQWRKASAAFARLPEILRRLARLERQLAERAGKPGAKATDKGQAPQN
jgi:UDP-3-O-[3-hydroxymyristoyl] glucosamine N-acyltransferase